jgi:hypothetical protein
MTVLRSPAATYVNLNWMRKNSGSEFPANAGLVFAATSALLRGKSIVPDLLFYLTVPTPLSLVGGPL